MREVNLLQTLDGNVSARVNKQPTVLMCQHVTPLQHLPTNSPQSYGPFTPRATSRDNVELSDGFTRPVRTRTRDVALVLLPLQSPFHYG